MDNANLVSVQDLVKSAFEFTKRRAKVLYGITAVMYAAYLLTWVLGVGSFIGGETVFGLSGLFAGGALAILGFFVFIIVSLWTQVALYESVINESDFKTSFANARGKLWDYFSTSLLAGLITAVGFILLVVPGLVFMIWYFAAGIVVIAEGISGMAALRKSKSYVEGRWGVVFARVLAVFLLVMAVQLLAGVIFPAKTASVFSAIFIFAIIPFISVYTFLLYKNLKETTAGMANVANAGQL